jgi:hypothetical protein
MLAQGFSPGFGSKRNRPERAADHELVLADLFGSRVEWVTNRAEAPPVRFGRPFRANRLGEAFPGLKPWAMIGNRCAVLMTIFYAQSICYLLFAIFHRRFHVMPASFRKRSIRLGAVTVRSPAWSASLNSFTRCGTDLADSRPPIILK